MSEAVSRLYNEYLARHRAEHVKLGLPLLSSGSSRYGAQMGRSSRAVVDPDSPPPHFYVECIGSDEDGYDYEGAYWGVGQAIYFAKATNDGHDIEQYFSASSDREDAEEWLRKTFHGCTFHKEAFRHDFPFEELLSDIEDAEETEE